MENITKKIKYGSKTLFCHEPWLVGEVVNECFKRLFKLLMEKNAYVKDMIYGIRLEGCCWSWIRNLFTSEIDLMDECKILLSNILLRDNIEDT